MCHAIDVSCQAYSIYMFTGGCVIWHLNVIRCQVPLLICGQLVPRNQHSPVYCIRILQTLASLLHPHPACNAATCNVQCATCDGAKYRADTDMQHVVGGEQQRMCQQARCTTRTAHHASRNMHRATRTTQYAPRNMHRTTRTTQHEPRNMHRATYTAQHAPCIMPCATCTAQHAPRNMHCATCTAQHVPCNMHRATWQP